MTEPRENIAASETAGVLAAQQIGAETKAAPSGSEQSDNIAAMTGYDDGPAEIETLSPNGHGNGESAGSSAAGIIPSVPAIGADGAAAPVTARDRGSESEPRQDGAAVPRPAPFRSFVDEISDREISGWILSPEQPSRRCIVALKEGGQVLARAVASRFRDDLLAAGIGDGCHAFLLQMPRSLLDGREHWLEVVEEESGLLLTKEPLHWRAGLSPAQDSFSGAANRSEATRPFDLARQPAAEMERFPVTARSDYDRTPIAKPEPQRLAPARLSPHSAVVGTRILFDVSDLVYYIGEHANLTGIQRVQSSIVLAVLTNNILPRSQLTFLSFNAKTRNWVAIPTGFLESLLQDLFLSEAQRLVIFPAEEARYGLLPGAQQFDGTGTLDDGNPSVLCLLGAAWVHQDYIHRVLALKRRFGTRFVMTVHDLIPIYARDTCDQDTARVFEEFMRRALRHADHLLSVSENTAKDLRRYTRTLQIAEPPITVTRNGSSFAEFLPIKMSAGELGQADLPERFVLFVATIEGRKNHQLMLDIWRRMIADGDDPPHLVCVGRLGWKSSAFISTLVETHYLGGKVLLLRDICDADLRLLYNRCLFTVCPTLYEGWGLPVGEALALGRICVSSDRASIPEVAGEFGVYIDIDDFEQSLKVVRDLIANAATRNKLEAKIRHGYVPITWREVAEKVVAACLATPEAAWQEPYPYTAIPYSSEISFARLDRNTDGTGELLLTRIAGARKGLFVGAPLDEQAFVRGEEARTGGWWAYPEEWGTWACHGGGELALALAPDPSQIYYVFLRLRASGPVIERPVHIAANGDLLWGGAIGPEPRDIMLRVHPKLAGAAGWRLRLKVQIDLTPELRDRIAALDSRIPTIGFERLIVVPENDLKTRVDILYALLL
jgi:glycosyltransferase involved in cell wall biosynthesis